LVRVAQGQVQGLETTGPILFLALLLLQVVVGVGFITPLKTALTVALAAVLEEVFIQVTSAVQALQDKVILAVKVAMGTLSGKVAEVAARGLLVWVRMPMLHLTH
jgi:hypothetical protein